MVGYTFWQIRVRQPSLYLREKIMFMNAISGKAIISRKYTFMFLFWIWKSLHLWRIIFGRNSINYINTIYNTMSYFWITFFFSSFVLSCFLFYSFLFFFHLILWILLPKASWASLMTFPCKDWSHKIEWLANECSSFTFHTHALSLWKMAKHLKKISLKSQIYQSNNYLVVLSISLIFCVYIYVRSSIDTFQYNSKLSTVLKEAFFWHWVRVRLEHPKQSI